ncbi:hypothetical protein V5N11_006912 [Cardamine amara subsp. amara]|uniref:Uncharacterized protein n=1 Tax=Cardamine amara subsp. amara TaxID=228776 RepID=A0ABD1BEU4_CARAN
MDAVTDMDAEMIQFWAEAIRNQELPPPRDSSDPYAGVDLTRQSYGQHYDVFLCGRLGLYSYNFHKGTSYKFDFVSNVYTQSRFGLFTKFFMTLEAVNPAENSPFTLEACVKHHDLAQSEQIWWETCFCMETEEEDNHWDNEALPDHYKGELPKWFSDANHQQRYVVEKSELMDKDNEWLHLFTEFAFYTKWNLCLTPEEITESLPLEISEVVVETEAPREKKLKAANAIFYISFKCDDDPLTGEVANYRAVVRKTMDGKPEHMRLDARCWSIESC